MHMGQGRPLSATSGMPVTESVAVPELLHKHAPCHFFWPRWKGQEGGIIRGNNLAQGCKAAVRLRRKMCWDHWATYPLQ